MLDLSGYRNVALQFSGGKDSLALVYLLRRHLHRVTVYWVDAGDGWPETREVIEYVRSHLAPRFVEVKTDARAWREAHGQPSDLVPATTHEMARSFGMDEGKVSNHFACCAANRVLPMHQRMLADKVDAVIRGTKLADTGVVPAEGKTEHYDVLLPLKTWTHEDVFRYLESVDAPVNRLYSHFKGTSAPECMTCTGWWSDSKSEYLRAHHPKQYVEHRIKLVGMAHTLRAHMSALESELGVNHGIR